MASSEKFCLRWNDFETNISVAFRELREEKDFFDVTLACDDSQIQAHKVILSACSPFFRNVLRRNPHQHPLLYLKGVKYKELLCVLNFMYQGEVNVAQEELNSFLAVAEDLRVKGLTQNNPTATSDHSKNDASKLPSRPRDPPERDPVAPPPKRPRPTPPAPVPTQQSFQQPTYEDDDIQEVVPVKSEPRDTTAAVVSAPTPHDSTVAQYGGQQQQQQQHDGGGQAGGALALDDSYADESYDYGQYGDGGYDDGSGMIDPNTGMPMQGGGGADGNKDLNSVIASKMIKVDGGQGLIGGSRWLWQCADCDYNSPYTTSVKRHIESKHVMAVIYQCDICLHRLPTKNALSVHKARNHPTDILTDG